MSATTRPRKQYRRRTPLKPNPGGMLQRPSWRCGRPGALALVSMQPAVLFDLDGTLLDHEAAAQTAVVAWAAGQAHDHPHSNEALVAEWLRLEQQHFAAYLAGALTFQEQRRARLTGLLAFLGRAALPQHELDLLFQRYLGHYEGAWRAYDDAVPALDELAQAGVTVGVLTNGQDAQQQAKLRAVGMKSVEVV